MPLGASFLGITIALLLRSKKLFLKSFIFLYFFSMGLTSDLLISYVEKPYKILPVKNIIDADSVVVLGGMRELNDINKEIIEWNDPDRFFAGLKVYKEGKAKRIIFTDGYNPFFGKNVTEGVLNKRDAISMGISEEAIMITGKARNTQEESQELRKLFDKNKFLDNEIILITSAFHMKRAKRLFERSGFKVFEFPVDFKPKCLKKKLRDNLFCLLPRASSLNHSSTALREIIGRVFYQIN